MPSRARITTVHPVTTQELPPPSDRSGSVARQHG